MTLTRKFSQFVDGGLITPTDEPVGLEAGANTIWTGAGSGGGSVTQLLPQPTPPVTAGQWLKITLTSGLYTGAQGDNADDAEVIGLVVSADATNFTLQQSGYVTTAMAVPGISGLTPGMGYFISTASPGVMVPTDALVNDQVSRPVFVADSPTSGWIVPYRGLIVGGAAPSGGGGSSTDSNIVNVTQMAHGFVPGNVVRVSTANSSGAPISYALAQANTLANAQSVGVVLLNPAPTTNTFSLQFAGYNTGSLTVDQTAAALTPATVYYLSSTVPGAITATDPGLSGAISRPVYISEQGIINSGSNSGYILPQRPLMNANGAVQGSTLIAVASASNSVSVNFDNQLSSLYNIYLVYWENVTPIVNGAQLISQIGTGSTPTYQGSFYSGTAASSYGGGAWSAVVASTTQINLSYNITNVSAWGASGNLQIGGTNNPGKYKQFLAFYNGFSTSVGQYAWGTSSQAWQSGVVLTSVKFFMTSGNMSTGTFYLYGLNI